MLFARSIFATPLFNRPDLSNLFKIPLPLDNQGLLRALEMIAFPGTTFKILENYDKVFKVQTTDYPHLVYTHEAFIQISEYPFPSRRVSLPSIPTIQKYLEDQLGQQYLWGGNYSEGIEKLLELFPPANFLSSLMKDIWKLKGLDCSGLLYQATKGLTPRNSRELCEIGEEVSFPLQSLDLIVWPGHVIIMLDEKTCIESLLGKGVIKTPLSQRINELLAKNQKFNLRRWHPEALNPFPSFFSSAVPLTFELKQFIQQRSWNEKCPVPLEDLSYLTLSHFGFDNKCYLGELIVHKNLAKEVIEIFSEIYYARFPIERMRLIDHFCANDIMAMEENNTSCFCYREATLKPGILSKHSFGAAIDINPLYNPYIKNNLILPQNSIHYTDRSLLQDGMISEQDACYKAFAKRDWVWGGLWKDRIDYQHFEKKDFTLV